MKANLQTIAHNVTRAHARAVRRRAKIRLTELAAAQVAAEPQTETFVSFVRRLGLSKYSGSGFPKYNGSLMASTGCC